MNCKEGLVNSYIANRNNKEKNIKCSITFNALERISYFSNYKQFCIHKFAIIILLAKIVWNTLHPPVEMFENWLYVYIVIFKYLKKLLQIFGYTTCNCQTTNNSLINKYLCQAFISSKLYVKLVEPKNDFELVISKNVKTNRSIG